MKKEESIAPPSMRPTDIGPPASVVPNGSIVKIQLQGSHAIITAQDGSVRERYPASLLSKRFPKGRKTAFFKTRIKNGALEIDECVADQKW